MRPQTTLKRVGSRVAVSNLANVRAIGIVKLVNGMLPSSTGGSECNPSGGRAGSYVSEHHNVAALPLLVVNQWQHVDLGERREGRILEYLLDLRGIVDFRSFKLESRKH